MPYRELAALTRGGDGWSKFSLEAGSIRRVEVIGDEDMKKPLNKAASVEEILLEDDGRFPNNSTLPTLFYEKAFELEGSSDSVNLMKEIFRDHQWSNGWVNGLFPYDHYHSTAHEVLGCASGHARVQLGGPGGPKLTFEPGDVLVLPAGVSHKRIDAATALMIVGAYAGGCDYDIKTGAEGERPLADRNIAEVQLPEQDPVFGTSGPLVRSWGLRPRGASLDGASPDKDFLKRSG